MKQQRHNTSSFFDLVEVFLPIIRMTIPGILLWILMRRINKINISAIGVVVSSQEMATILIFTHVIAMCYGSRANRSKGWYYELACCTLPTEIILYLYYLQHQFALAVLLLYLMLGGFVFIMTYGRKMLSDLYQLQYLPQPILNDINSTARHAKKTIDSVLFVALRRYFVVFTAFLLVLPSISVIVVYGFNGYLNNATTHAIIKDETDNLLLANIETIQLFQDDKWAMISEQDKINALQIVSDIETHYLNIDPVFVVACPLNENTAGEYQHSDRIVCIDMKKHEEEYPLGYIKTVLHECRHAFQYDCVDSLDWDNVNIQNGIYYAQARQWQYEQEHYIHPYEDYEEYYQQDIENDARTYASNGMDTYAQFLYLFTIPSK